MKGNQSSLLASDDAVSESIGYILIIGIIIVSLGIIYAIGYPMLTGAVDDGHFENMENGFDIMSDNMERVSTYHAPGQSVELKLKGGTLRSESSGRFNVTLTFVNDTTIEQSWVKMSLVYIINGKTIGYECGGVMENDGHDMYVLKEPGIVNGDPYIIPIDKLWSQPSSVSGDGLAKVTINGNNPTVNQYSQIKEINITVESEFYESWARYFEQSLGMTATYDSDAKVATGIYKPASPIEVMIVIKPLSIQIL